MPRRDASDRRSLPVAEWPDADQLAWSIAIAEGDILDGRGPASHWADITKRTNIRHYGRWLAYLTQHGILAPETAPADRITAETVRRYNAHLESIVAPRTRLSMLVGLKVMIKAMAPGRDWRWLQDVCNHVQRNAPPSRDKRSRMRPSGEIFAAAIEHMRGVDLSTGFIRSAIAYRDALMLALAAARPLRVRNLAAIEIGRHLVCLDDRWLLAIPAEETKTQQPIEFYLPKAILPWLHRYLEEVRPMFPGAAATPHLWLGMTGGPIDREAVSSRISKLTKRLFGKSINAHLLRDCAATSLAHVSADAARAAAPLLGHRYFTTTERFYIQANNLEASRRHNAILEEIRAELEVDK